MRRRCLASGRLHTTPTYHLRAYTVSVSKSGGPLRGAPPPPPAFLPDAAAAAATTTAVPAPPLPVLGGGGGRRMAPATACCSHHRWLCRATGTSGWERGAEGEVESLWRTGKDSHARSRLSRHLASRTAPPARSTTADAEAVGKGRRRGTAKVVSDRGGVPVFKYLKRTMGGVRQRQRKRST